ncbi:MAG: type polyketide synthase [Betaproteobacteria bacterium]|nr:type polyketide synthase [Betaproteobacteria bacterium]
MPRAFINAIGCAVPPHDIHAAFVEFGARLFDEPRQARAFMMMAARAGIAHRYSTLAVGDPQSGAIDADAFYRPGRFPDTASRMQRYETHALPLAVDAVKNLGAIDFGRITHLIVASCTGFSAPGVELQLIEALGLPKTVFRSLIGFMGCAAAVPALRIAGDIVMAHPEAQVLVVNVELCTLHFQDTQDLEKVLSFLLFSDGASAALVTSRPAGAALGAFRSVVIPDSAGLITWKVGNAGFEMHLSGAVPATIAHALDQEARTDGTDGLLQGAPPQSIDHWAVHAGGRSVLDAVERSFALRPDALAVSRSVLNDFGNMSSATVMFALKRIMEGATAGQHGTALAFGPGMVAESFQFEIA